MSEDNFDVKSSSSINLVTDVYTGTAEESYYRSPFVPDSYQAPYNSDDLYKKTGSYSIYEDMLNDDQVSICLKITKDLILGSGFFFESKDDDYEEIVKELINTLSEDTETSFLKQIEEVLSNQEFGFSISEKVFYVNAEGRLRLKKLVTRHPNSFLLHQDAKGNVEKYEQQTSVGNINLNPKSLIHFINNPKFQNPYGTSDLRAAYAAWFSKRQIIRYYAIFLEKAAGPIPVARYDKNAPAAAIANIHAAITKFQTKTALTIPKEIELEFLQSSNNGEVYSKAINIFNMFIGRSLFIPDLLGMTGSETSGGSQSLGREQMNVFFMHIKRKKEELEELINRQIIWPLVVYNYGFIDNYPKFRFKPIDDSVAVEFAKIWLEAVKGRVFQANEDEINHFRDLVKFPQGEVEFTQPASINPLQTPQNNNSLQIQQNDSLNKENQNGEKENGLQSSSGQENANEEISSQKTNEEKIVDEKKSFIGEKYNYPSGDYHKKVDFKKIETKLNDYDNSINTDAKKLINKVFADLYDQLKKKKVLNTENVDRLDTIKIRYLKELKLLLQESFKQIYKDGQSLAASEIFKSNFAAPKVDQSFLDILENENYNFIGEWEYNITKKVKLEMIAAIKDGRPLSSVISLLDEEGKKMAQTSIDRYARTKHTEVFNKGRLQFFKESKVVSGYQYSAILDERTSDICRGLDGKKFLANEVPVPPLHFYCRSVLIPITIYEEFTPSETVGKQNITDFIEENKGSGFATQ